MASERRVDPKGHRFSRPLGSRRIWCEKCRPPVVKSAPVVQLDIGDQPARSPLEQSAFLELAAVGRQDTPRGLLYLGLCRQFEAGGHTGSQMAALSARILEAQRAALEGAPRPGDVVDDLQARRNRARRA